MTTNSIDIKVFTRCAGRHRVPARRRQFPGGRVHEHHIRTRRPGVRLALAALICTLGIAPAGASAAEGEYRGYLDMSAQVRPVKLRLALESRSQGRVDELRYRSIAAGGDLSLGANLMLGGYYSRIETRGGEAWSVEHRPYVDVTLRTRWSGMEASDRSRAELRVREGESSWRYRNRGRLSFPIGTTSLSGFVDGEVFVTLREAEISATRVTAGLDARVGKAVKLGVAYIYETRLKGEIWSSVHAIGLRVGFDAQTGRQR